MASDFSGDPAGQSIEDAAGIPAGSGSDALDSAQAHEQALQAMRAGDYAVAYCTWRPLAEANDAKAQFSLGWMYHNGYGLAIDDDKTLYWWRLAAAQGMADASMALGMMLSFGDGGRARQDLTAAVGHYLDAISRGHPEARTMLLTLLAREAKALQPVIQAWGRAEWTLLGWPARIKVPRANVREGPSTGTSVLTQLVEGDEVLGLARQGDWLRVAVPGRIASAWVHGSLVDGAEEPKRSGVE